MMNMKRKLATTLSLIAAGLLAISVFAIPGSHSLQAAETDLSNHRSILHITSRDARKGPKFVKIGLGKSMVLELPRPVRDVLVSNPKLMDAVVHTSNRVYLIGLKVGQANAFFFDKEGAQILTLEVSIEQDMTPVKRLLGRLLPGSNIKLESINDNVIMTGSVRTPAESNRASDIVGRFIAKGGSEEEGAKRVVNMLAVESREQVMLKVQVVEMNREIIKQLGVDLEAVANVGGTTLSLLSNTPFTALGKSVIDGSGLLANGVTMVNSSKNFSMGSVLKAMERNGMTRVLAEPNLTAISGETAKFHAGGEFPIPVASEDNKISVEWKKFGVLLNFTPVVLSEGRISLQIKSEVSELSQEGSIEIGGITLPGIATRNAESTVELPSGGSLMMAGLISTQTRQAVNGLPGLKNLPVLGTLFRSRDYVKKETELVILVTPYIVKPVSARKLVTPDVGYAEASDAKANLLGHFNRVYGRRDRMPRGRQHGDYGFIVE